MNLYKIIFDHYSPKDHESGIKCLLFAQNDEEVYDWLGRWEDYEDDEDDPDFKVRMIALKGDINDKTKDNYADAYYGNTVWGWELLREDVVVEDYKEFVGFGLIKNTTDLFLNLDN